MFRASKQLYRVQFSNDGLQERCLPGANSTNYTDQLLTLLGTVKVCMVPFKMVSLGVWQDIHDI